MLHTERLTLRQWTAEDFEPFARMFGDPQVAQFVTTDGKPLSRHAAWRAFCVLLGHWQLRGYGQFALVERQTNELIGRVGPWFPEEWPGFEIGWTLRSESWGRGYATEAANKCLEYVFTQLDCDHVISLIAPTNIRSARVAEKLGEQIEGHAAIPDSPAKLLLKYGLHKDEWQRQRS